MAAGRDGNQTYRKLTIDMKDIGSPVQLKCIYTMQMNTTQEIINDGFSLDAKIVARMAGLHYQTILRHIRNGNLPASRSASYMIRLEDVRLFISNLPELTRVGPRRAKSRTTAKA